MLAQRQTLFTLKLTQGFLFCPRAAELTSRGKIRDSERCRLGAPCEHRNTRSARSRRDGCNGVESSGHDIWRLLGQAVSDTPERDRQCGVVLAPATTIEI